MRRLRLMNWLVCFLLSVFLFGCGGSGGGGNSDSDDLDPTGSPTVTLTSHPFDVTDNTPVVLEWSSTNTDNCTASGDWSGVKDTEGREDIGPLTDDASFTLTCSGNGAEASQTVTVTVGEQPAPSTPSVTLHATPPSVTSEDGSTELSWSSSNADTCEASGAWTGSRAVEGKEIVDVTADSTFTLTCQNSAGASANASVEVTIDAVTTRTATLSWTPPTKNTDGSDLTDLMGYRIHVGTSSGVYTRVIPVNDNTIDGYVVEGLTAGTWFFAVSAVDTSNNESALSNEESKVISIP